MTQAAIDVLIPVYNGAKTVESAIASIQAQTVRDIRIIVVNDGSTDASASIVERMAAADPRIMLINKPNSGIVDALNAGLTVCTADLVARHDADDLAVPERFEKQVAWMREHPNCDAVSGAIIHIDESGRELSLLTVPDPPSHANPLAYPQKEPYLVHPFLLVRRASVMGVGGYRHVYHAEDTDLYWRLQEVGELANMNELMGYYRVHNQSVTSASTLNGRIAAMSSQLCGLSALRRRSGRPDIAFPRDAIVEYKAAVTLAEIVRLGSRGLDPDEAKRLAAATGAKLLELAGYRPYEIDLADCAFIRDSMAIVLPTLTGESRALTRRVVAGTSARLATQGKVASALRLCPPQLLPQAAVRVALRTLLPHRLWHAARKIAGRPVALK